MPTARLGLTSSVVNNKIYAIGGYREADVFDPGLSIVEEYNPASDTWAKRKNLPEPRAALTSSSVKGKI